MNLASWSFILSVVLCVVSCMFDLEGSNADVTTTQHKTTEDNEYKDVRLHIRTAALGFNKHHIRTALDFIGIKPINAKEMTEYIFLHSSNLHQQQPLSSQPLPDDAEEGSALTLTLNLNFGLNLSCVALSSPVLSCVVLFYDALSCPAFSCRVMPFVSRLLSCFDMACLVLSYRVVSCLFFFLFLALSCLVLFLSCLVFSFLACDCHLSVLPCLVYVFSHLVPSCLIFSCLASLS